MLLDKNKKSSSFRLDMMDTVVISLLKKQKKEKQMEKSVPYDSKYQKEKSLSWMMSSVVVSSFRLRK